MIRAILFVLGFSLAAGAEVHASNFWFGVQAFAGLGLIILSLWDVRSPRNMS